MAVQKLEDKAQLIQAAKTENEAFEKLAELGAEYGYDNCIYSLLTDHPTVGRPALDGLVTPGARDWRDYYLANNFRLVDPKWEKLMVCRRPFAWAEMVDEFMGNTSISDARRNASLKVLRERADAGLVDGASLTFVSPAGEIAGIGWARSEVGRIGSCEQFAELCLLTAFFHERFLGSVRAPDAPRLTPREREVLHWAAEGRSDYDVSHILNVSASTIRFHWNNIFRKLGVTGRVSAVVRAMQLQIISPHGIRAMDQS